ncbi:MAG: ferrous iron transport protein A [Anaerolineae bacterium]|nr:ferrous iron transport protein A [Anaerolineae bacterium]
MTLNAGPDNEQPAWHTLADLRPGETAEVAALHSAGAERRRLMDLGIVPGTTITAELRSPLNDPVAYRVRGALIALRRSQAAQIEIRSPAPEIRS